MADIEKIKDLEQKIEDLKGRFPKHSLKPAMMQELEELEAELEAVKKEQNKK